MIELGAALAGLTLVTVNPAYLGEELAFVLRQSRARGCPCVEQCPFPRVKRSFLWISR
jgi:acyl-CoA synthetase (AMP-forming)/AMP-acid ligase II